MRAAACLVLLVSTAATAAPPAHPRAGDRWKSAIGMEFIWVATGRGAGFWLGATEVTVAEWRAFHAATLHPTHGEILGQAWSWKDGKIQKLAGLSWRNPGFEQTDAHPVTFVSWHDATAFCDWLGREERLRARLPTEREWELAARAGTRAAYPWGDDPAGGAGWLNSKSFDDGYAMTSPVRSFKPNAWGFYDLHGNALEWTADWFTGVRPDVARYEGPRQPEFWRTVKGGSFAFPVEQCSSAARQGYKGEDSVANIGFRVLIEPG